MFPRPSGLVKIQHLKACPDEAELLELSGVARKDPQTQFDYVWANDQQKRRFMISVRLSPTDPTTFQWTLYVDAEPEAKRLWHHSSNNFSQIFATIQSAVIAAGMSADSIHGETSWDEQCRTFDGAEGLPIIQIDRLHEVQPELGESALKGELALVGIQNVLNSISMSNLTGRLRLDSEEKRADIFFTDGAPVHATSTMGDGMECMLRLAAMEEGHFFFDPRIKTNERTIHESIPFILLQGAKLADNTKYLHDQGLISDSVLIRINPNLSEQEFEHIIASGEPLDVAMMKATYLAVHGESTLKAVVRKVGLSRTQWVPIFANLIKLNIVGIQKAAKPQKLTVVRKVIPPELLAHLGEEFTEAKSGLFSYPAFLYMLERESYKADAEQPVSLVVFDLNCSDSNQDLQWAQSRILSIMISWKRKLDILGHFEHGQYAMIMPGTNAEAAATAIAGLHKKILSNSALSNIANTLQICFGIATLPQDADDMMVLLAAAEAAKMHSEVSRMPIVLASNIGTVSSVAAGARGGNY